MVGMQITFGNCDQQTPHGGAPFHYWKKGYGFGHSKGPGQGNVLHPAAPVMLRFTPGGDRGLAASPFWRGKWELGPATSFGIGDRPDLYQQEKTVGPDNYGDISSSVSKVRRNAHRAGITIKARFPSIEEKYRDLSWPQCGPGPGKYDTSIPTGQSSWSNPSKVSAFTFGVRQSSSVELREMMSKPGAGDYEVRRKPGKNCPLNHGTLYNISMHGKVKRVGVGEASPGPARYNIRGKLDEHGLLAKIENVQGPPDLYWRQMHPPSGHRGGQPLGAEAEAGHSRTLSRVESSPI